MIARALSKRAGYDSSVRQAQEAAVFQALGDANRRAILEELRDGERSVAELTRRLGISQPSVSRHLRLLRNAGLVEDEPDGARRLYRLRADGAEAVRAYIESLWGEAAGRFQLVARNAAKQAKRR
jgi:DNA-binding transcriptional ArsR family regulator